MIPMTIFDANCLYVLKCLALVFVAAPCVLFAGGMLICLLMWCGLRITRALHLRRLGLPPNGPKGGRVGGLYRGYFKVHSPPKKEKR